jgi:tetratricopeptide (TPR) repeat protein
MLLLATVLNLNGSYVYIFYIDASSISSLQTDLTSAIRSLGVTYLHGTYNDALAFLSHTYGIRWLVIFDNADDPSVPLEDYFPQCDNGTIIVTTRNAQHSVLAPDSSIEIGPMDEGEAVRALLRAAHYSNNVTDDDRVQAREIVVELGCLPVAIVQAGRFCSTSRNLPNYLAIFKRQPRRLLERTNDRQADRYRYPSAFAALSVSHKELSDVAKTLLHMLTFFHHSDIPLTALRVAVEFNFEDVAKYIPRPVAHEDVLRRLNQCLCPEGDWDDLHIQDLLDSLEKYSIISITKSTTTQFFRFHPLTRVWAQSIIQEEDKLLYWSMAVQVLTSCSTKRHKRLRRSLLPHIHAVLDTPLPIHPNSGAAFARLLSEGGATGKASRIWEDIREKCIEVHGLENPVTVKATRKLANTLRETNVQRAEILGLESVELSKSIGSKESIIRTSRDAAVTFQKSKKWKEAGELLQGALDMVIALKGGTSDHAMEISEDLAQSHQAQGQWSEAEALRIRVLEVRQKNLQPEHADVIEAMENLAETYLQQGRWKEAAQLQEHVLAVRSRLLGAAHPDTMTILGDLAISYQRLGNWNDAATLQREILHNRQTLLPEHHPDVLEAMANVAITDCNQGRWERAEELQREVMDARQKLLGKEHVDSVNAMDQLARTLVFMARWTEGSFVLLFIAES